MYKLTLQQVQDSAGINVCVQHLSERGREGGSGQVGECLIIVQGAILSSTSTMYLVTLTYGAPGIATKPFLHGQLLHTVTHYSYTSYYG